MRSLRELKSEHTEHIRLSRIMCNRVAVHAGGIREMIRYYDLAGMNAGEAERLFRPGFVLNGFEKPFLPAIVKTGQKADLGLFRWGLVPHWVKDVKQFKANTLNSRNDELFEKPSFRNYWKNRCLIIVNGFFEPRDRSIAGLPGVASNVQRTESWYIRHVSELYLTLGGLFCDGTLTIITTDASPLLSAVHNEGRRMPLIFDDPELRDHWLFAELKQEEMSRMMDSYPDDSRLEAYRTIDGIFNNRITTNYPEAVLPHPHPESWVAEKSQKNDSDGNPEQMTLF